LQTQLRSFLVYLDESHTLFEKVTAVTKLGHDGFASKRPTTHAIRGLFSQAFMPACHAYSAIVDSFFFLEKHYIAQYYLPLIRYVCVRLCQCFG